MSRVVLLALLLWPTGLWALDVGGSLDVSGGGSRVTSTTLTSNANLQVWVNGSWGGVGLLARMNLTNAFTQSLLDQKITNTVGGGLDTFLIDAGWLRLGRSDQRDFTGTVLNTKLDGLQVNLNVARVDLKAFVGTSALVFKSASTIILGEEDTKDRQVYEDWQKPETLWAPRRAVAGIEASAPQWVRDQSFQLSLLGQADLRPNSPSDGDRANTSVADRVGAPVSTAYLGLGWTGRLAGPLYGTLWAYGMAGTSLTSVGAPVTVNEGAQGKTAVQYQTWKATPLWGGLANAEVNLLLPSLSFLLVNAGVQVGSWDPDGATPDQNAGESPSSLVPTPYTGWTGISRTGGALLFNPQPTNLAQGRLIVSIKPAPVLQVAASTFASVRAIAADVSETGVRADSSGLYLGTEADLSVLWRPASDLGFTLSGGAFVPNAQVLDRSLEAKFQTAVNLIF